MKSIPSFQFYPSDWLRDPGLRLCSLNARGLWIDMLAFMHEAEPYGHLRLKNQDVGQASLARMVGCTSKAVEKLLAELEQAGVFSRTEDGTIFSRRMVRDEHNRRIRAEGGKRSLKNPNVPRPKFESRESEGYPSCHPSTNPLPISSDPSFERSPSSSSSSSSFESKKAEKIAVPVSAETAKQRPRRVQLADEEFISALRNNTAYRHIDIDLELGKMDAWLLTPKGRNKKKTRQRIVNWLNRAADEHRVMAPSASVQPSTCVWKVPDGDVRRPVSCGKPIAESQPGKQQPFCDTHLLQRQRVDERLAQGVAG